MKISKEREKTLEHQIDKEHLKLKEKYFSLKDKWISGKEAMEILKIKSKTTLQKLRDNGSIIYSKVSKKNIMYDIDSIEEYIEKNSNRKERFK